MDSGAIFIVGVRFARLTGLLSGIVRPTSFFSCPFAFSIFSFSTNLNKNNLFLLLSTITFSYRSQYYTFPFCTKDISITPFIMHNILLYCHGILNTYDTYS